MRASLQFWIGTRAAAPHTSLAVCAAADQIAPESERSPNLLSKEFGLLPYREVTALVHLVEVHQVAIGGLADVGTNPSTPLSAQRSADVLTLEGTIVDIRISQTARMCIDRACMQHAAAVESRKGARSEPTG